MTSSPLTTPRRVIAGLVTIAACVGLLATSAQAVTRSMTGSIFVENPSAGIEGRGGIISGPSATVEAVGTTPATFVGREMIVPQSRFNFSGLQTRDFPPFTNVGQTTKVYATVQNVATFRENNGALADVTGATPVISWCPPAGTPAVGPGNLACTDWTAPGSGNRGVRIAISNASGRPNYGGSMTLLRNLTQNVWRITDPPTTPNALDAEASRSFMSVANRWAPGLPNFSYTSLTGNNGPIIVARLNARGAVVETDGCANGIGTIGVGGTFVKGEPRIFPGNNCGTDPAPDAPGQGWGFKMTTGTISGSDVFPFGLVVTTVGGTVFQPNFGTQPPGDGFFFSRMGTDMLSGSERNLVLLGGGVNYDPSSFNAFFRISRLRIKTQIPEPSVALGLLAGVGVVAGLARRRYRA